MIEFRCRTHRTETQKLWQVADAAPAGLAGRAIEYSRHHNAQTASGWVPEARPLSPGLYCQHCLLGGTTSPISDYDVVDLKEAGFGDIPHIGLTAASFDVDAVLAQMRPGLAPLIVAEEERAPRPAKYAAGAKNDPRIDPALRAAVDRALGGGELYSHQASAIQAALDGRDVVVETATASGKSLCYWIPALNAALGGGTVLYLAPLNALVEDQLGSMERFSDPAPKASREKAGRYSHRIRLGSRAIAACRYDGTVPNDQRKELRAQAQVLITNPDMLHSGILPHHHLWERFFANLAYVVVDEMHVYKGMFGANFAHVLRRVLRVAASYGKRPQIIACSASIGNPVELFEALSNRKDPVLIRADESGAPVRRQRRVILDVGRSTEAMPTIAKDLLLNLIGDHRARTIGFMRSISEVDQVCRYVKGELGRRLKGVSANTVMEYKREIPPQQKAAVTADMRSGATLGVISTTALQLGIDIGELSACIVCKFPGSKAAFMQQAGRVGRTGESLVLFVADESPLDQHYVVRPAELLSGPPEVVYLNPRHRETVLSHLRCAAEEVPLDPEKDQQYWGGDLEGLLKELSEREDMDDDGREVLVLNKRGEAANEVKLRSLGFECKVFDDAGKELARPDVLRAMRRFHKYARFQIQEKAYEVSRLSINWGKRNAEGTARLLDHLDYTTAPVILTECEVLEETDSRKIDGTALLSRGGVKFNIHVDGYYKVPTGAGDPKYQHLGPAAPPKYEIETDGLWFTVPTTSLAAIDAADHEASMSSALEALRISAALLCSTDPDDVGHHLDSSDASAFVLYLADKVAGGNGLTEQVYHQAKELVAGALRVLTDCPHCSATTASRGCARCVTTPWGQDDAVCRDGGITILKLLLAGL